jgi:hypothetical protein
LGVLLTKFLFILIFDKFYNKFQQVTQNVYWCLHLFPSIILKLKSSLIMLWMIAISATSQSYHNKWHQLVLACYCVFKKSPGRFFFLQNLDHRGYQYQYQNVFGCQVSYKKANNHRFCIRAGYQIINS